MKYELKIALPMYQIIYSMLFMVIIILVRPIMSYNEIVSVLESSVALLAGVFMADIYYMEYMNERISTYSLFPIKQKRGSILKRAFISQLYLIVLVAVFYWGFVLVYHPTNYSGVPVISLYASCLRRKYVFYGNVLLYRYKSNAEYRACYRPAVLLLAAFDIYDHSCVTRNITAIQAVRGSCSGWLFNSFLAEQNIIRCMCSCFNVLESTSGKSAAGF